MYRVPSARDRDGSGQGLVFADVRRPATDSAAATAPSAVGPAVRAVVVGCDRGPAHRAARGPHHAGVHGGVQRAAAQRAGLLRGHVFPGRGRLAGAVEKETVGVQQVQNFNPVTVKQTRG